MPPGATPDIGHKALCPMSLGSEFSTVQGRSEGPGSDCTAGTSGRAPSPAPPHASANHTPPDANGNGGEKAELWWERFNPVLHPIYREMTVDGNPLEGE